MKWYPVILLSFLGFLVACDTGPPVYAGEENLPCLKVKLDKTALSQLQSMRDAAMDVGYIPSSSKEEVAAVIEYQEQSIPAEVRLKGDWLDHIKNDKWSLRIKLKKKEALFGARRFSVQDPRTRDYLSEWVYHRLLQQEGILTPDYTFVRVWWNEEYKGIFALEEHFDEPLLERQGRRAAPILKFSEDGFWQIQADYLANGGDNLVPNLPDFEAADIEAFQDGRISKDPQLTQLFLAGKKRMEAYRQANQPASELLDMEGMAKLFALADIAQAYHSLRWHNLRFYYNPFTTKLEPVIFDAYGTKGAYLWFSKPYLGFFNERYSKLYFPGEYIIFYLFNEPAFRKQYAYYLKKYTEPTFISTFLAKQKKELEELEKALQTEFRSYRYDQQYLVEGATRMQAALENYEQGHPPFSYVIFDKLYEECKLSKPLTKIAVKATVNPDHQRIHLQNFFCQPLQIIACGPKKSKSKRALAQELTLPPFDIHQQPPPSFDIPFRLGDKYVFYKVPGQPEEYRQKIDLMNASEQQDLFANTTVLDSSIFVLDGDTLRIKKGRYVIRQQVHIPESQHLVLEAGVVLDLIEGASVLVEGGLSMRGTPKQPIRIHSSDGNNQGWQVLQSPGEVDIRHVHFDLLNTGAQTGRQFSGAVTLYEIKGKVSYCQFSQIKAEDALNVFRSDLDLEGLVFADCYSDGLDVDFSEVRIQDCRFDRIGGDALDFSGSKAMVNGLLATSIGDKAISVGEGSEVILNRVDCKEMKTGLAVKDASRCQGSGCAFDSCQFGIAVFTKKKNYAKAGLSMDQVSFGDRTKQDYLLEEGHELMMGKKKISYTHPAGQVLELLYAQHN